MTGDVLDDLDATGLAELVRSGKASPRELVDAAIARIEAVNPTLNAVIHPRFDQAREEADGPLPEGPFRGVPFLLKDIICHSAGDPFHEGMRFLKELDWRAKDDTYLAAKYKAAGLVVLGRTNAPELGIQPTTEPEAYGATLNPWDTARSPGGSSGGSAAAVAARMVPAAHANDGGGSIRIPASACGLVGLKPSRGRTSLGPDGYSVGALAVEHVVCRSVRDAAGLLDATAGRMPGDPYVAPPPKRPFAAEVGADPGRLRVGLLTFSPSMGGPVDPDCVAAATGTAALLESLGHHVEVAHPPGLERPEWSQNFLTLWGAGVALGLETWSRRTGRRIRQEDVEPLTWALAETGDAIGAMALLSAHAWLSEGNRDVARWWRDGTGAADSDGFDLLVTPTLAEPPVPLGTFAGSAGNPLEGLFRAGMFCPFTPPFNVTGQPAVSLPLHWTPEGLPVGVQLVAAFGAEDVLLRVAAQLEEARPWAEARPPVSA
jgi:amidase